MAGEIKMCILVAGTRRIAWDGWMRLCMYAASFWICHQRRLRYRLGSDTIYHSFTSHHASLCYMGDFLDVWNDYTYVSQVIKIYFLCSHM